MPGSGAGGLRRTMSRRFAAPRSKPLINADWFFGF
tara:strand:- start:1419 stop:1523 length:105 start_codon:yes stop_codon:yes gene_type:complete